MSDSPTITKQLLDAITNPDVRAKIGVIIDLCVGAVTNLDSLDQGIYDNAQVVEKDGRSLSNQALEGLAAAVLDGVRALASHLLSCDFGANDEPSDDAMEMDFDFDLGGPPPAPDEVKLDDADIDSVLDGFAPEGQRSCNERWAELSAELTSFSYGLSAQLDEFDQRFGNALGQQRFTQALRELDDVGNALIDGVFALMSAICEAYLEKFDRDQMLPGHRDTLGKALLVRRGVADLRGTVKAVNARIQDAETEKDQRQAGINTVAEALSEFISSESFSVMRPADRLELQNFLEEITDNTGRQAALSCEGFDKYLDSLLSVNQRDVLIRHDREIMSEIAATLEGVAPIVDISPHGAMDMVRQAFSKARALYGFQDALDDLLTEWDDSVSQQTEPAAMVEISARLSKIADAALK